MYSQSTGEVNSNKSYVLATSKVNPTSDLSIRSSSAYFRSHLTTLEVMTYYLVVHMGPGRYMTAVANKMTVANCFRKEATEKRFGWKRIGGVLFLGKKKKQQNSGLRLLSVCVRLPLFVSVWKSVCFSVCTFCLTSVPPVSDSVCVCL